MQKKRTFKAAFTCRWAPSDGQPGKDGVGIKSADVVFVVSASDTTPPADNAGWVTLFSQLTLKDNAYVWSCTKMVLTNGTTSYTGKQYLGACKDFVTITEQYAVGASPTTAPTSGWGTNYTPTKELWLWTRNRMRWTDGSFTYTTPICIGYFGRDGSDGLNGGKDAVEFVIEGAPMVFDTDDNGVVPSSASKVAYITVYRSGEKVTSSAIASVDSESSLNCAASVVKNLADKRFEITVRGSSIKKDTTYGVSVTSGYATVNITYDGVLYVKQVAFEVNVSKFTGKISSDNKSFEQKYTELSNTVDGLPLKTQDQLTEYTSTIEQTAREISLSVGKKVIDQRRNLLTGSDFHRQGFGYRPNNSGTTMATMLIRTNDSIAGCNSLYVSQTDSTKTYSGVQWYRFPVKSGAAYTISVWAKRMSDTFGNGCSLIVHQYDGNGSAVARQDAFALLSTSDTKGAWARKTYKVTMATTAAEASVIFCLGSTGAFSIAQPMMEEGSEYTGWSLSEGDWGFLGGNILEGTKGLSVNTSVPPSGGTTGYVSGVYGSASTSSDGVRSVSATVASGKSQNILAMAALLKAGVDYTLSFDARRTDGLDNGSLTVNFLRGVRYSELYTGKTSIYSSDNGNATESGYLDITTTGQWQRVWIHFRLNKDWTTATGYNIIVSVTGGDVSGKSATMAVRLPKLEASAYPTEWTDLNENYVEERNIANAMQEAGIDLVSGHITLRAAKTTVTGDLTIQGALTDSTSYVGMDGSLWSPNDVGELTKSSRNLLVTSGEGLFIPIDMTTIKSVQVQTSDPSLVTDGSPTKATTALITLPMYDAVNLGCGVTTPAYRRSGTHVIIRNAFSLAYNQWSKGDGWTFDNLRRNIASSAVYICTDPRTLAMSNYKASAPAIAADGRDANGKFADADYFKGCMYLNGRRGRWLALLPGQQVELVSVVTMWQTGTNTPVPYLAWYVVGGDGMDWLEKNVSFRPDGTGYSEYGAAFSSEVTGGEHFGVGSEDKYADAFFGYGQLSDTKTISETVVVTLSANSKPYVTIE